MAKAGDDVEQGRLAAAARADEAEEFSLRHLQRNMVERVHTQPAGAKRLRNVLDLENDFAGHAVHCQVAHDFTGIFPGLFHPPALESDLGKTGDLE